MLFSLVKSMYYFLTHLRRHVAKWRCQLFVCNFIVQRFRIIGSGTEYRIDKKVVSPAEYNRKLESIGIFTKAKNFLVFQVNEL